MTNGENPDSLFLRCVDQPDLAREVFGSLGPRIDEWPSGVRTLSFGEEGRGAAPACIAVVGALAVRAETGSLPAFNSYGAEMAAALSSSSMQAALENMGNDRGLLATLAIATNLEDGNARPSLRSGTELISRLNGMVSASDTISRSEMRYTNGDDVVAESAHALEKVLTKVYGHRPPEDVKLIYAYSLLISLTEKLTNNRTRATEMWRGALVETCQELEARLPAHESLDRKIPQGCYGLYLQSRDMGIEGRPQGTEPHLSFKGLPRNKRTVSEAMKLNFNEGIPSTGNNYDAEALSVDPSTVDPSSYTGQRIQRIGESKTQQYLDQIAEALDNYWKCREFTEREHDARLSRRRAVETAATRNGMRLLDVKPHIRPGTVKRVQGIENHYRDAMTGRLDPSQQPPEAIVQQLSEVNRSRDVKANQAWADDMAGAAAAVAARRHDSEVDQSQQRAAERIIQSNRASLARQLINRVGLLVEPRASKIDADTLREFGLNIDDVRMFEKDSAEGGVIDRGLDDAVPLHILQLAADVLNFNASSVLPQTSQPKVKGKPIDKKRYQDLKDTHGGGVRVPDTRENGEPYERFVKQETKAESEYMKSMIDLEHWTDTKNQVDYVTDTLTRFVNKRYGTTANNPRVVAALVECALAEERGFWEDESVQTQVAARAQKVFNSVPRETLPAEAQSLVDMALSVAGGSEPRLKAIRERGKRVVQKIPTPKMPFRRG